MVDAIGEMLDGAIGGAAPPSAPAPAATPTAAPSDPVGSMLDVAISGKAQSAPEKDTSSSATSVGAQVGAGLSGAMASVAGGPMDLYNAFLNYEHRKWYGDDQSPYGGPDSIGGSQWFAKKFLPTPPEPKNEGERLINVFARGTGEAVSMASAAKIAQVAKLVSPKTAETIQALTGKPTDKLNAVIGGTAAVTGDVAANQQMIPVPDKYKPLVATVAGLAGGAGVVAPYVAAKAAGAGLSGIKGIVTQSGRELKVGRELEAAASDPQATAEALRDPNKAAAVPGVGLTSAQQAGDMGLAGWERGVRQQNPVEFQSHEQAQNEALTRHMEGIQPTGDAAAIPTIIGDQRKAAASAAEQAQSDFAATSQAHVDAAEAAHTAAINDLRSVGPTASPTELSNHFRSVRNSLDAMTLASVKEATGKAGEAAGAVAPRLTEPEQIGGAIRTPVAERHQQASDVVDKMYGELEKKGNVQIPSTNLSKTAMDTLRKIPAEAKPQTGEEKRLFDLALEYGAETPLRNIRALRSSILNEMAATRRSNPEAFGRLNLLRAAVDDSLDHAAEVQFATDKIALERGAMDPKDALSSRMDKVLNEHPSQRQATAAANENETGAGAGQRSGDGASKAGAKGAAIKRSGDVASGEGVSKGPGAQEGSLGAKGEGLKQHLEDTGWQAKRTSELEGTKGTTYSHPGAPGHEVTVLTSPQGKMSWNLSSPKAPGPWKGGAGKTLVSNKTGDLDALKAKLKGIVPETGTENKWHALEPAPKNEAISPDKYDVYDRNGNKIGSNLTLKRASVMSGMDVPTTKIALDEHGGATSDNHIVVHAGDTHAALANHPDVFEALNGPHTFDPNMVDRTHDIPYLAGSSKDNNKVYIDKRVPEKLVVKTSAGGKRTIDPARYLEVHERFENATMNKLGMKYEVAHEHANEAERRAVEDAGINYKDYQTKIKEFIPKTEHETIQNPPPDLFVKGIYPEAEAKLLEKKGGAVSEGTRTNRDVLESSNDPAFQKGVPYREPTGPDIRPSDMTYEQFRDAAKRGKIAAPDTRKNFQRILRPFDDSNIKENKIGWEPDPLGREKNGWNYGYNPDDIARYIVHDFHYNDPDFAKGATKNLLTEERIKNAYEALQRAKGGAAKEPESIEAAAVKTAKGQIYKGIVHSDIYEKHGGALGKKYEDGFITNTGRFVDRKEALKIAEQTHGRIISSTEYLHAADLNLAEGKGRRILGRDTSAPERVEGATIRVGDKIFKGPSHPEIYLKHENEINRLEQEAAAKGVHQPWEEGFSTDSRPHISREEAAKLVKEEGGFLTDRIKGSEKLKSEDLTHLRGLTPEKIKHLEETGMTPSEEIMKAKVAKRIEIRKMQEEQTAREEAALKKLEKQAAGDKKRMGAVQKLREANAAHREMRETYGSGPVGEILAKQPRGEDYALSNAEVASKIFHPGDTGGESVKSYLKATNTKESRQAIENAATFSFDKAAIRNGVVDAKLAEKWMRDHAPALRELRDVLGKAPKQSRMELWHGSLNQFDVFDPHFHGTGAGQSEGPGHYFSPRKEISDIYSKSDDQNATGWYDGHTRAADALRNAGGNYEQAIKDLRDQIKNPKNIDFRDWDSSHRWEYNNYLNRNKRKEFGLGPNDYDPTFERIELPYGKAHVPGQKERYVEAAKEAISVLEKKEHIETGYLYKVEAKAHPDEFIDYDRPISEQPGLIQNFFKKKDVDLSLTGEKAINELGQNRKEWDELPRMFIENGIAGTKYQPDGPTSDYHNFVVADRNRLRILERNGEKVNDPSMESVDKFSNAINTQRAVEEATARHKEQMDNFDKSEFARIAGLNHEQDVVSHMGAILASKDAATRLDKLAQAVEHKPRAKEGMQRAVLESIFNKLLPDVNKVTDFFDKNHEALSKVFGEDAFTNELGHVHDSINMAQITKELMDTAKIARDAGMKAAANQVKVSTSEYDKGILARLMKVEGKGNVIDVLGSIFSGNNSTKEMAALMDKAKNVEGGIDAVRKGVQELLSRDFTSSARSGVSETPEISRAKLATFFKENIDALEKVFTLGQVGKLRAIIEDGHRINRTINAIKLKGGPGTAQDLISAAKKHSSVGGSTMDALAFLVGEHLHGAMTGIMTGVGAHVWGALKAAGISNINQLRIEAALDPALASKLLERARGAPNKNTLSLIALRLRQLALNAAIAGKDQETPHK